MDATEMKMRDERGENEKDEERKRKTNGEKERRQTEAGHRCKLISKKSEKEGNVRSFVEGERIV